MRYGIRLVNILGGVGLILAPLVSLAAEPAAPAGLAVGESVLYTQIKQAKALLEPVPLNYALTPQYKTVKQPRKKPATRQVLSHYTLDIKDIALAVYDPTDGQTKVVMAMQKGTEFEFPPQYKHFDIQKVRFNGVNTRFTVNSPAGGKILALKYLITPKEQGGKSEIVNAIYSGVYVPYSPELGDAGVSQKGSEYLDSVIAQAAAELSNKPSVSEAGKTVPEAISAALVRALIYAEHMDTTEFFNNPVTAELVEKVNILLAGNEGDTWKYSVSTAGAAGISQFIPSTYKALVARHSDAHLIPDFVTGMRNHVNAVKSTFLLLDDYIQAVHDRTPDHFLAGHAFDYGAAAYNGGPVRVARAAKQYGAFWYEDQNGKLAPLQADIDSQTAAVNALRAQIKKTKNKTAKASLNAELKKENARLTDLKVEHSGLENATLRNETVNYLKKIHRLIQHFNDHQPVKQLAARS